MHICAKCNGYQTSDGAEICKAKGDHKLREGQKHTQNSLTFNVKQNNAETQNVRGLLVQLPWIWGEIIYWKLFI